MKRKEFLHILGSLTLAPALSPALLALGKKPRYNVLVIHTDEHNFRTLGCYRRLLEKKEALMWGSTVVTTPHIDSIAERGILATASYVACPSCSPSRASFISGLYPMDTDVIQNDIPIRGDLETFAGVLHKNGYATGYAGKWHLDGRKEAMEAMIVETTGKEINSFYDFPELYDGWVSAERGMGFADNRFMFDTGHWKKIVSNPDGNPIVFHPRIVGDEETFSTDWLTDRTLEFIDTHKDEAFCYMVSYPDPHGPDFVREPYYSMYKDAAFETPYTADKKAESAPAWAKPVAKNADDAAYFGMVKCIDDNVGRLLRRLDKHGLTDRTIVVFTCDHGDLRGEHGRQDKGVPYEASVKVPFVMAAPGLLPVNRVVTNAFSTVDFKPTLLGLLGLSGDKASQGYDKSHLLQGTSNPRSYEKLIFSRSPGVRAGSSWLMATDGRYKLVASPVEPLWFFDLEEDPSELTNLAGIKKYKSVITDLARSLIEYAEKYDDPNLPLGNLLKSLEKAVKG